MTRFHISTNALTGQVTATPFTAAEETDQDAADAAAQAEAARQGTFTSDATRADILNRLKTASASQIRTFVANQVTDLASARTMLANILVLIALDPRN